ncbi:hypothetical protein IJH74_02320 [Candidatus Saccharibacteria bacterium]|nr:hypothetical protein [Candidatus Saccharibacteria bacterium]
MANTLSNFRSSFEKNRAKIWSRKHSKYGKRKTLHRSFRRSYREDYERPLEVPGLMYHAMESFRMIFKNWRIFLLLILFIVFANIILVGLMSENLYLKYQESLDNSISNSGLNVGNFAKSALLLVSTVTTGGLAQGASEVQQVFATLLFLTTWLVTIYLVRHLLAGHKVKLRDGLYNALAPLISTLAIFIVVFCQLIPIFIVIIVYQSAVATDFLSTPFYALLFFIFAALLILLSLYLLSSTFLALVAVTAPGLYPMAALSNASDLIAGRRIKLIIRLIYLFFVLAVIWAVIMLPLILLDLWLKSTFDWLSGIPFVSIMLLIMTVFSVVYFSVYSYLFYRRILDYDD